MSKFIKRFLTRLYDFLATNTFFGLVIGLLAIQALWIAISGSYPLPFDEYYHVGLINIYSHRWSPFISHQPASAAIYGDITRNTSYLYHYLMSFPYRIIGLFTGSFTAKVIILRIINIAIFCAGLYLFRKVLFKLGLSRRLTHAVLLCFVMVPLVPLLAAHVNYDNLLFGLIALNLLLTIDIIQSKTVNSKNILLLLITSFMTCLVKYTFLPIMIAIYAFTFFVLIRQYGKKLIKKFKADYVKLSKLQSIILIVALLISAGLFMERYGLNVIRYHSPQPDCIAIQPYDVCKQLSPWARDNIVYPTFPGENFGGPVGYTKVWVPKMINDAFVAFAYQRVDPASISGKLGLLVTQEGLSIPKATAKIIFAFGIILILLNFGKLWKDKRWQLVFLILIFYAVTLWIKNYGDYTHRHHVTAVQPRYMLILAPLALAAIAQAYNKFLKRTRYKAILLLLVLLALFEGGGVTVYILRSDPTWYWSSQAVVNLNHYARNILSKLILLR